MVVSCKCAIDTLVRNLHNFFFSFRCDVEAMVPSKELPRVPRCPDVAILATPIAQDTATPSSEVEVGVATPYLSAGVQQLRGVMVGGKVGGRPGVVNGGRIGGRAKAMMSGGWARGNTKSGGIGRPRPRGRVRVSLRSGSRTVWIRVSRLVSGALPRSIFPSSVRIKSMRRTPMLAKSYTISEGIVTFEPKDVDIMHRSKKRVKCEITRNFEGVKEQAQLFRSLQETFTSQISLASKDEVPSEADIIDQLFSTL
jgi:hypothetical protein